MGELNMLAGWIGISAGFVIGAVAGLAFHKEDWLGGYASWRRRMFRLGHISLFGIGFINVLFAISIRQIDTGYATNVISWLFIAGAVGMPLCCYASAFRKGFRHAFFVPVACLVTGGLLFVANLWGECL